MFPFPFQALSHVSFLVQAVPSAPMLFLQELQKEASDLSGFCLNVMPLRGLLGPTPHASQALSRHCLIFSIGQITA